MVSFLEKLIILVVLLVDLCEAAVTAAYFRPTSTLDPSTLPLTGKQIFVIGGWFKWSNCTEQFLASDDGAEKGYPPIINENWDIWHHLTVVPANRKKKRKHSCNKWVAAGWAFSVSGSSISPTPFKAYLMPYVTSRRRMLGGGKSKKPKGPSSTSPLASTSTSKEIIYTVGCFYFS